MRSWSWNDANLTVHPTSDGRASTGVEAVCRAVRLCVALARGPEAGSSRPERRLLRLRARRRCGSPRKTAAVRGQGSEATCCMSRQARPEAAAGRASPPPGHPRPQAKEVYQPAWAPFAGLTLDTAFDTAVSPPSPGTASRTTSPGSDVSDQQLSFRINLARSNANANRKASKSAAGGKQRDAEGSRSQRYISVHRLSSPACARLVSFLYAACLNTLSHGCSRRCIAFIDEAMSNERRFKNPELNKVLETRNQRRRHRMLAREEVSSRHSPKSEASAIDNVWGLMGSFMASFSPAVSPLQAGASPDLDHIPDFPCVCVSCAHACGRLNCRLLAAGCCSSTCGFGLTIKMRWCCMLGYHKSASGEVTCWARGLYVSVAGPRVDWHASPCADEVEMDRGISSAMSPAATEPGGPKLSPYQPSLAYRSATPGPDASAASNSRAAAGRPPAFARWGYDPRKVQLSDREASKREHAASAAAAAGAATPAAAGRWSELSEAPMARRAGAGASQPPVVALTRRNSLPPAGALLCHVCVYCSAIGYRHAVLPRTIGMLCCLAL